MKFVRYSIIHLFSLLALSGFSTVFAQLNPEQVTIGEGTVLRLALSKQTPIGKVGQPVEARVVEPVYSFDRLVIPAEAKVFGTVTALKPVSRGERILAMTGGDFTPIRDPEIQFDRLEMPDGTVIHINTTATHRNTKLVELRDRKSKGDSLFKSATDMAREKLGLKAGGPSKLGLIKKELFSYLPYHPQYLDRGSLLDAELSEPVALSTAVPDPVDVSHIGDPIPNDTLVHARLVTELGSNISTDGQPIEAVLTEPVWGPKHELLYPEGTRLLGKVIKAQKAGWLGRSGQLRFMFQSLQLPTGTEEAIKSQIEALETQKKQNITLDAEGGTRAHFNNRFLAPIINYALADLASKPGKSRIKRAVVSNGFKLAGRISGFLGTQNVSTALSYYGMGRSVYTNIISKGPEATFPANSRLAIRISQCRGDSSIHISNFGEVNENYYRGGQPDKSDVMALKKMGVKTIIDLQENGKAEEEAWAGEAGLNFYRIPLSSTRAATAEQTENFLKIANDPASQPVYVHCAGGKHRTGSMTAIYRITHDGWTAEEAFAEMEQYGYYSFPNHGSHKDFVFEFYNSRLRVQKHDDLMPEPAVTTPTIGINAVQ